MAEPTEEAPAEQPAEEELVASEPAPEEPPAAEVEAKVESTGGEEAVPGEEKEVVEEEGTTDQAGQGEEPPKTEEKAEETAEGEAEEKVEGKTDKKGKKGKKGKQEKGKEKEVKADSEAEEDDGVRKEKKKGKGGKKGKEKKDQKAEKGDSKDVNEGSQVETEKSLADVDDKKQKTKSKLDFAADVVYEQAAKKKKGKGKGKKKKQLSSAMDVGREVVIDKPSVKSSVLLVGRSVSSMGAAKSTSLLNKPKSQIYGSQFSKSLMQFGTKSKSKSYMTRPDSKMSQHSLSEDYSYSSTSLPDATLSTSRKLLGKKKKAKRKKSEGKFLEHKESLQGVKEESTGELKKKPKDKKRKGKVKLPAEPPAPPPTAVEPPSAKEDDMMAQMMRLKAEAAGISEPEEQKTEEKPEKKQKKKKKKTEGKKAKKEKKMTPEMLEKLKKEQEEEAKRQALIEKQRLEEEKKAAIDKEKRETIEAGHRAEQLSKGNESVQQIHAYMLEAAEKEKEQQEWEEYLACARLPNPSLCDRMTTYLHLWELSMETSTVEEAAQRTEDCCVLLEELQDIIDNAVNEEQRRINNYKWIRQLLREYQQESIDRATYRLLRNIEKNLNRIDIPTADFQYSDDILKLNIWLKIQLPIPLPNPRRPPKSRLDIAFSNVNMEVLFPMSIDCETMAFRAMYLMYDHLSDLCESFHAPKLPEDFSKTLYDATRKEWRVKLKYKYDNRDPEPEVLEPSSPPPEAQQDMDYGLLTGGAGRASAGEQHVEDEQPERVEEIEEEIPVVPYKKLSPTPSQFAISVEDEFYAELRKSFVRDIPEGALNLRQYLMIGGVFHLDLLYQPPQPQHFVIVDLSLTALF